MSTKLNIDAINDGSLPLSKLTEEVLPLSGGKLNANAYIEWGNSGEDTDISNWNAIMSDTGLRIISSIDENSGAPKRYSTGLHVRGRYGFQLASEGGGVSNFFIRNIGTSDLSYTTWQTLIHSGNLSNYALPINGGTLTGNLKINGVLTLPGLESNNDYIENKAYDNGLWGTESGKSPEMTHDLASIKNAIKFNWYNDDWIIGNIRAGSAASDGFGIGIEKTKDDGTIYQKNVFRLSPAGEIYLNGTPLANKYLSLSGGTLTGNLVTVSTTGAATANLTQQTHIIQTPLIQTGLPTGSAIQDYCKGLVKTLCTEYLNKSFTKFIGNLSCDTTGTYECFIYDTSLVDSESGLPQYAYGTVRSFTQDYYFSIINYVWKWGSENTIFATADKATRANYATYDDVGNYISGSYLKLSGGKMTGSIYPNTTDTINLGDINNRFASIAAGQIKGFVNITNETFKSNWLQPGLSVITNIAPTNGDGTYADYGLPASTSGAEGGVINFRTVNAPAANPHYYLNQLGFDRTGIYWRNTTDNADQLWKCLSSPSIFESSVPLLSEYSSAPKILPEIIHDNITNVFHDIPQTQILIERSQDGTTWTDTTETDYSKFKQVMSTGKAPYNTPVIAYDGANGQVGDRVRITINGACAYAKLAYIYVYYTTQGATTKLTVEKNTYSAQDTWVTIVDKEKVTGWSGPNYYGLENSHIGQTNGNNGYSYRLTFEITAISSGVTNVGYLHNIWAISSDRPWSITNDPNKMFYFNVGRWKHVTNKSIEPLYDVTGALGSSSYRWSAVYAKDFYGTNFYGTAQKAIMDASGRNIADTYALASTCYGGPEGKFAIGNSDNLIGKALTSSWGIYNGHHDIIISEYDSSTETWVEKFNSTSLTSGSANYNAFVKGVTGSFYTSTRGSKVKMTVTANAGSVYVQAISLYLKSKDATYSGNIDYTYSTNSGNIEYSGTLGTWGSWCPITMSLTYRTSFEVIFNENEANAQLIINGFRIATQSDGVVPILIGKSHESYKADTATRSAMVGDGTIQLYAQSGNEINFGGTNTTNPTIIFGYKSADGNQIVPTQYQFGNNATASVYASKFVTTGGTASHVVLGDGTLKDISGLTYNPDTHELKYLNKLYIGDNTGSSDGMIIFGDYTSTARYTYIHENDDDCLKIHAQNQVSLSNRHGEIRFTDIEYIDEETSGDDAYFYPSTDGIHLGMTTHRFQSAYFSGAVYAANGFYESSDERLKDFGHELEVNLDELSKLRKSYFTFKDKPEQHQLGVSAQEIQKLYPEIVSETDDGYLNVDYSKLAVIALAAIDKLNEEIKELKKLINK